MIIEALTTVDYADNSLAIEFYYQEQIANTKKIQEERISKAEQRIKQKKKKED